MLILLFYRYKSVRNGVTEGIAVCMENIVPSLFPMLILSSFMSSAGLPERLRRILFFPLRILTGISEDAAMCFFFGASAGYPVGVKTASSLFKENRISRTAAVRAALLNVNPGLAFTILTVGKQFFGSAGIGLTLYCSVTLSNLILGILMRFVSPIREAQNHALPQIIPNYAEALISAVGNAVRTLTSVCAWIIAFSAFSALLGASKERFFFSAFLEVTSASEICAAAGKLPQCAFVLGFGGICILLQLLQDLFFLGIKIYQYLACRLLCGGTAYLIESAMIRLFRISTAVSSVEKSVSLSQNSFAGSLALLFLCAVFMLSLQTPAKGRIKGN